MGIALIMGIGRVNYGNRTTLDEGSHIHRFREYEYSSYSRAHTIVDEGSRFQPFHRLSGCYCSTVATVRRNPPLSEHCHLEFFYVRRLGYNPGILIGSQELSGSVHER